MYLIVRNTDDVVVAVAGCIDHVATTENDDTVTVDMHLATAVYDAESGIFYRFRPAYPGDTAHHVVEVETVPDGITPGRWRYVEGEFIAVETVDELTMTQLAVAELAEALLGGGT